MTKTFEFYFDYGSPYSYLANTQIKKIAEKHQAKIIYKPVLLGGIFKSTGNISPIQNPVQSKVHYGLKDINDWVDFYQCELNFNPHFPVNTLNLMRLACLFQNHSDFLDFHEAAFKSMWVDKKNMGLEDEIKSLLKSINMDPHSVDAANSSENKELLKTQTQQAVDRGVFGLPAFFVGDALFFGNDRLPLVEHFLRKLKKSYALD